MTGDARVGSTRIAMRRLDVRDATPRGERRRRDVLPRLAIVGGDLDVAVVRSDPDQRRLNWRRRNRVDDAALSVTIGVRRGGCIERRRNTGIGPSEVWTDLRLSLIHISEPTRLLSISYAVFCLK